MKNVTSCGIFLIDKNNKMLLGHPTGSKPDVLSIPKGCVDKGERWFDTAVRELKEETDISLDKYKYIYRYIGSTVYKTSQEGIPIMKTLRCYIVNLPYDVIDLDKVWCPSTFGEGIPEVDEYQLIDIHIAPMFMMVTQKKVWDSYRTGI